MLHRHTENNRLEVRACTAAWVLGHAQLPELLQRTLDVIFHLPLFLCEMFSLQALLKNAWKVLFGAIR